MKRLGRLMALSTVGLASLTIMQGCHSYRVRPMPQMNALEAPARATGGGAVFGARAIVKGAEVKAVFNKNMLSKGVVPIHLVVDNRGSSEIELVRSRIELETPSGNRLEPFAADAASTGEGRNAMAEAIFFFGIFSYDNANKYNDDLQRDWVEKGMGEVQLLRPGRAMSKFLYFEAGKGFTPSGAVLYIPYEVDGSGKRDTAVLKFE